MQYKIPVQIENEDPIVLGLSLRQLFILMAGFGISYSFFTAVAPTVSLEVALIPAILIFAVFLIVAIFKYSEMTFFPFVLTFIRFKINIQERKWISGIDCFQPIDIGYLTNNDGKKENNIDFKNKIDKIKKIDESLDKI